MCIRDRVVSRVANKSGGLIMFIIEVVFLLLVIGAAILLVQGVREIPVQYAKRIVGNKQYGCLLYTSYGG